MMAENESRAAGHPVMDYAEHEKTYRMFLRLIKYTAAGVAVILALLAFFWG
jgi:Bacterial aa3 type cytochrome c oxidase subunit IV